MDFYSSSKHEDLLQEQQYEKQGFSTSMFGFNREQVMACIERITKQNQQKIETLEKTIETLQQNLSTTLSDNKILIAKTREVCQELSNEKAQAQKAIEKAEQMQEQVRKADLAVADYRGRLFKREQQQVVLKSDNQRLKVIIDDLTTTVNEYEATREAWEVEREQKRAELDKLLDEARQVYERETKEAKKFLMKSAKDIAISVAALKAQLAGVDGRINVAAVDLQTATKNISELMGQTDTTMQSLGVQVDAFPLKVDVMPSQIGLQQDPIQEKIEKNIKASADDIADIARASANRIAQAQEEIRKKAAETPRMVAEEKQEDLIKKLQSLLGQD